MNTSVAQFLCDVFSLPDLVIHYTNTLDEGAISIQDGHLITKLIGDINGYMFSALIKDGVLTENSIKIKKRYISFFLKEIIHKGDIQYRLLNPQYLVWIQLNHINLNNFVRISSST